MLGWGALAFCTLGGAVGGYQVFLKQHEINLRENIKLRENQKVRRGRSDEGGISEINTFATQNT